MEFPDKLIQQIKSIMEKKKEREVSLEEVLKVANNLGDIAEFLVKLRIKQVEEKRLSSNLENSQNETHPKNP